MNPTNRDDWPYSLFDMMVMLCAMAPRHGWFRDPASRHRFRYRADQWTEWVADTGVALRDPDGLPVIARKRRTRWIVTGVAVIAAGALLVGCIAMINEAETSGVDEVVAELNGWNLPPSIAQSRPVDHVERGTFAATTPTVTRWYMPASGATPYDALRDLVSTLNAHGYDLSEDPPLPGDPQTATTWSGDCKYNSKYCYMTIGLDTSGKRIEVIVNPGG